jgi:hypothetical protein
MPDLRAVHPVGQSLVPLLPLQIENQAAQSEIEKGDRPYEKQARDQQAYATQPIIMVTGKLHNSYNRRVFRFGYEQSS